MHGVRLVSHTELNVVLKDHFKILHEDTKSSASDSLVGATINGKNAGQETMIYYFKKKIFNAIFVRSLADQIIKFECKCINKKNRIVIKNYL